MDQTMIRVACGVFAVLLGGVLVMRRRRKEE
jgi:LPXTG cell wall anchor motif